jgi:hypothetical protein
MGFLRLSPEKVHYSYKHPLGLRCLLAVRVHGKLHLCASVFSDLSDRIKLCLAKQSYC